VCPCRGPPWGVSREEGTLQAELTLSPEITKTIAAEVVDRLKPIVLGVVTEKDKDVIFTPESLAEYLQVDTSWVYKKVSEKAIPYFKTGKYTRFKKKHIDKWIETQAVRPVPQLKTEKIGRWPHDKMPIARCSNRADDSLEVLDSTK
jgi:excisionase family DNA binding protein